MKLNRESIAALLLSVAQIWEDNVVSFNEIDSKYGDGDHGVTIGKIVQAIRRDVAAWEAPELKPFFGKLSMSVMGVGGGSAGPLYGTLFGGLGDPLDRETTEVDAAGLKAMLAGMRSALKSITKAQQGDKTMMDALLPAVQAAEACDGDIPEILHAAAQAAREGADATAQMVSKFGRARSYGEQTLGTPDAGALSTALMFQGLDQGIA